MKLGLLALAIGMTAFGSPSFAQQPATDDRAKAMLVLDASGSMWGKVDGDFKIAIARRVVSDLMSSWDPAVDLGISAYGHRRKGDCSDIETIAPVGPDTAARVPAIIEGLSPKGKTPLTEAVRKAAEHLRYTENPATVILVTDGLETCDADPCAVAQELEAAGVDFTAHVIGFDLTEEEGRSVQCIAERTGGISVRAGSADALRTALQSVFEATKPRQYDKVRLALVEGGPLLEEGNADFRFYAVDANGQKAGQEAQNYGYIGFARVPDGDHVVEVSYGKAFAAEPLTATGEGNEHVVVLNAGIVRLNAVVGHGTLSLSNPLKWNILSDTGGQSLEIDSKLDQGGGAEFVLPPDAYIVSAAIGGVKKIVPITVSAGDNLDLDVDMRSGTLNLRAVLLEGGPKALPNGYFEWKAFAAGADGEPAGDALTSSLFAKATFVLPAGRNVVTFKDRLIDKVIVVDVEADQTANIDLPLDAAVLDFRVLDASGAPVGGYPYVDFYPRDAEKTPENRIGRYDRTAGKLNVPARPLDVVVEVGGNTYIWPIDLSAGESHAIDFTVAN